MKHNHRGRSSERFMDIDLILNALDIQPGQTILDAGCGNGYMSKEFAKHARPNGKVYAVDQDDISISTLESETRDTIIEPFVGDITKETKLASDSLGLIYLCTVFHGFSEEDIKGFISEAKRLLKSGGRLAIVEIQKEDTPFGPPMNIRLSPDELREKINLPCREPVAIGQYFYLQIFDK